MLVGDRMNESVSSSPIVFEDQEIHVTISVGSATGRLDANLNPNHLLDRADKALYSAKNNGRNRVEQFCVLT